ncbi:MAG: alpha-mannosidase [Litorivicinus sp.]
MDKQRFRLTQARARRVLDWIKPLILSDRQTLDGFDLARLDRPMHDPQGIEYGANRVEPNTYWGEWCMNFALRTFFTWPEDSVDGELYLPLGETGDIFSHPECLVFVDGERLGSADRHHHRVPVRAQPGKRCTLELIGWTGLSGWPHDPESRKQLFMRPCALVWPDVELEAYCLALEVALESVHVSTAAQDLIEAIDASLRVLDTREPLSNESLRSSLVGAHQALNKGLASGASGLDAYLHGIGHAHMDLAYLWTTDQTRAKAGRTFTNVIRLMERYPDYRFTQSQPQLYQWTSENYPDLFEQIRERVNAGQWELTGGMWVEPDCNIPNGESLVRQILWGRKYYREHFSAPETPVLFLPDTFGFNAQLPQLMRLSGLKYFMTNKTNWNQFNALPHQTFRWRGLDGSEVLAQTFTTPRKVQYLPHPTTYKAELTAAEVAGTWQAYQQQSNNQDLPLAYGYGDGGGGPNDPMIRRAREFSELPGLPRFKPSRLDAFFSKIEEHRWPVIEGELYLELHRGTYTSQAAIKAANVQLERALHRVEWWAAMALVHGLDAPRQAINEVWQTVLLNQFHDILPGTAIAEVFAEAHERYSLASRQLAAIEETLRQQLFEGDGLSLVNDQGVEIRGAWVPSGWGVIDDQGLLCPSQALSEGRWVDVTVPAYSSVPIAKTPLSDQPTDLRV